MKPWIMARVEGRLNKKANGEAIVVMNKTPDTDPPAQHIPDDMIPPNL
jgi:hypothetical protein